MEQLNPEDMDKYIQDRYIAAINYYWAASKSNKLWYKITRTLTVFFGALVTLISALASPEIITQLGLKTYFSLGTPLFAFLLTIIAGFSQSFQWGSTWQNMILTAQQLQKEYDKYLVTPVGERKFQKEADKLNDFVISETNGFFDRMLGGGKVNSIKSELQNNDAEK